MVRGATVAIATTRHFDESESGRRLDEVDPQVRTERAQPAFFMIAGDEIGLKDDLEQCPMSPGDGEDPCHVVADIVPIVLQHLADIHDHIQLPGPLLAGEIGLKSLARGGRGTVRKTDHGTDDRFRISQRGHRQGDGVRLDTDRRHPQFGGDFAALPQLVIGQGGMQQGVVDETSHGVERSSDFVSGGGPAGQTAVERPVGTAILWVRLAGEGIACCSGIVFCPGRVGK